jgi:S-methylmethionine-dependent homocysteine/selenocysteine methylase
MTIPSESELTGAKYRERILSLLEERIFLEDSGLETTLIYHDGITLPEFASFVLLQTGEGTQRILEYSRLHARIAVDHGVGQILGSVGWRASRDWGRKLGISEDELRRINIKSIQILKTIREELENEKSTMIVAGAIGPRADGYIAPDHRMTIWEAEEYHRQQVLSYHDAGADAVIAYTINYVEEAIGIAKAAHHCGMPVAISFTVETNGHLPSGQMLKAAITEVDLVTGDYPLYYMINCAHPLHFLDALMEEKAPWVERIRAIKANASKKSHAELEESTSLDAGDPEELGKYFKDIRDRFPHITIVGGCCGTDHRHILQICQQCGFHK